MLYHFVLGLPADASDEDIRRRYLELVKKHPPEKSKVRFQQITHAYEAIRTHRQRIEARIFGTGDSGDFEEHLHLLAGGRAILRRRVGLEELFEAERKCGKP